MAITGIDTIEGKQIIAAGAVSAKSAEMAYNDENGNPITGYQVAGDYLTTADSANFYTTANESGFITEVPDTYLQNTDLEISDNKITGISGVPLAAGGGDVPEGVMAESGLEYNAVDEISGYNGSAFAQYGAEKQWLVHDDTLVHASNSAQYALGCNISALQRLMGIDETVLYTANTGVTAFTASEPLTNFKEVVFYVAPNTNDTTVSKITLPMTGHNTETIALTYHSTWNGFKGGIQISTEYTNTGMSAFQLISGAWFGWASNTVNTGTYYEACIYKIIGIGRKEI